jgi:hypothetical protein
MTGSAETVAVVRVRTTAHNGRLRWKVPIAVLGQPPGRAMVVSRR